MDKEAITELFAPLGFVSVRRMFGGAGIYRDELMIALEAYGELYLKVDSETASMFEKAGSLPFTYEGGRKPITMSYWQLPAEAYDDPDAFRRWGMLAAEAAMRSALKKTSKGSTKSKPDRPVKPLKSV
jgi:DNA transformation protein and related proteins